MNRIRVNGISIIDWTDRDGKLVSASVAEQDGFKNLSPDEQRKLMEDARSQLGEEIQIKEAETRGVLKREQSELLASMPPNAWADYGDDVLRKHVPMIGIEDPKLVKARKGVMQALDGATPQEQRKVLDVAVRKLGSAPPDLLSERKVIVGRIADIDKKIAALDYRSRHITLADLRHDAEALRNTPGKQDDWLVRWHAVGFPTFELTGGLAAALSMTECKGLRGRDFQTPFPVFAVQMPRPSPLVLPGGDVRVLLVDGKTAALALHGDDHVVQLLKPSLLPDDEHIEAWARQHDQPQVARFLVNLCVYINSVHAPAFAETKPSAGGSKSHRGDSSPKPPQRWVIGREIKLSPGMLQAARAAVLGERTAKQRAEYRMHVRFMVRGHWRNQACGTKHADRKLRWIEPFWKGPEMAEGLARLYAVEGEA